MDRLEEIFKMQYELNKRIGVDTANMSEDDRVKWVLNYSRALAQENAELVDSVPWKWWAKYQKFDPQNARVEVVDMLHFLVSIAQTLGMTADDFYQAYAKKNHINHDRQDSGYTTKERKRLPLDLICGNFGDGFSLWLFLALENFWDALLRRIVPLLAAPALFFRRLYGLPFYLFSLA